MIIGIVLSISGFVLFLTGGIMTNDEPGVQRTHAIMMGAGLVILVVGGILLVQAIF